MNLFYYIIAFFLVISIAIQAVYSYSASKVSHYLVPSDTVYSKEISDTLWVTTHENGEIDLKSTSALEIIYDLLFSSINKPKDESGFSKGFSISSLAARSILIEYKDFHGHYYNAVVAIWITNNWTSEQIIATILDKGHFGFGIESLPNAAKAYFNKAPRELDLNEAVALLSINFRPSVFNPICRPKNFIQRAERLQLWLNSKQPEEYGDFVFVRPQILRPAVANCGK